jgi:FAD/FMN-containing dehydrogenase
MNSNRISRRALLKGAIAGVIVLGFDPLRRSWVTAAGAGPYIDVPPLDGVLLTDPASLTAAADDFGHIVHRQPIALLKPGSVDDIIRMVRYARQHGLTIGARGQGHTAFGQSLVDAGIVIDMSTLNTAPEITGDHVTVRAGVMWGDVLLATLPYGLTAPVITGYLGLSVGGTLSVGGIGGSSYRFGAQVDNVIELEIVTGQGRLEACSASQNPTLFEVALAGLGQCGIIISATLRLIPAQTHARLLILFYADLHTMLQDERLLIADGRFDHAVGYVVPSPAGGWAMFIEAARDFTAPAEPENSELLAGLSYIPGSEQIVDLPYFAFASRVDPVVDAVKAAGRFNLPHPWFDIFVPDSEIDGYADSIFATLTPADLGPDWPILFFPLKSEKFTRPLLRIPDEEIFFLFDILHTAPDAAAASAMVAINRQRYERARALGSKHYTISAIPLSQQDWKRHFQPFWGKLESAKHQFDPDNVLTPGPGIFDKHP